MDRPVARYDQERDERRLIERLAEVAGAYEPLEVHLFGSRVAGRYLAGSDWDLAVVSERFAGTPLVARGGQIGWALSGAGAGPIELLCYTYEEFDRLRGGGGPMATALRHSRRLWPPAGGDEGVGAAADRGRRAQGCTEEPAPDMVRGG